MSTHVDIGDLQVGRLGFGAMWLTGPRVWGWPADREAAMRVARRAVELGVTFIDTADSYGPGTNEELLADALYPYGDELVFATKAGQSRPSPTQWVPLGRPEYLRQQAELSLRRLRLDCLPLFYLHRIDPAVPAEDQFGALRQLQDEGRIRHIGLSEVSVEQIEQARRTFDVAAVQNLYNLGDRRHEAVLDYCSREGIAFVPWSPVARGKVLADEVVIRIAKELDASPAQVSLAWLLHRAAVVAPIPGTSSRAHLEENLAACELMLSTEQFDDLAALA